MRETGVSGDELYQAIGQSEVVSGMSEEQRDTLFRDVGAAQSSSSAAQDVEVGSFGTGSEIGPYVPESGGRLVDTGEGVRRRMLREEDGIEQAEDLLGEYDKAAEVERGGLDPFDAGPHVPNPENLLDRLESGLDIELESGRDIELGSRRDIEGEVDLGRTALATELDRLKAQGGGVWRRDPDTGDMARVPDEEVERWMERPHVPEPGDLLDRGSRRDIEGEVDLGRTALCDGVGSAESPGRRRLASGPGHRRYGAGARRIGARLDASGGLPTSTRSPPSAAKICWPRGTRRWRRKD